MAKISYSRAAMSRKQEQGLRVVAPVAAAARSIWYTIASGSIIGIVAALVIF